MFKFLLLHVSCVLWCMVTDCRCRQWMCDRTWVAELPYLTVNYLQLLQTSLPQGTQFCSLYLCGGLLPVNACKAEGCKAVSMSIALPGAVPRHPKDAKYVDSLLKLATLISSRPFNMDIAGDALRRWVQGTEAQDEPLRLQHMRIARAMHPQVSVLAPPFPPLAFGMPGALGLEPEPSVVRVVCGRATHHDAEASPQAVFVYSLADDLVREHGHTWEAAVVAGHKCWERIVNARLRDTVQQAISAAGAEDSDREQDALVPMAGEPDVPVRF